MNESINNIVEKLRFTQFKDYLQPRPRDFYKEKAGHVLVIGGDDGYSGAVRMAGEAALRTGAGLVSIATRKDHAAILNTTRPEIMCHGVTNATDCHLLFKKAKIIIIGPGMGQSPWAKALLQAALQQTVPLVIDADALNLLAKQPSSQKLNHCILTPHPGEAARLLNLTVSEIQRDRLAAVKQLQKKFGGVCILKGAGSLIAAPDSSIGLCEAGNPGMATAGMGDVLSGVIAGLLAQDVPLTIAAKMGVCLHATAGDLAAHQGQRGMLATDLLPYLRQLVNK